MVEKHSGFDLQGEVKIDGAASKVGQVLKGQGAGATPVWGYDDYGLSFIGTVTGVVAAPKFQCSGLTGFGNDFFKGYWAYVVWDAGGAGAQPQGQKLECTGYVSADGDFTVAAFAPNVIAVGDKVLLLHPAIASLINTTYGLSPIKADTQIRSITSAGKSITFGAGNAKWLNIDSGENGAEILAIILNNYVGKDWTVDTYVPYVDVVAAPAAIDKRDTFSIVNTDAEGGLLKPTAIAYNMFLDFTNDAGAGSETMTVTVVYRSRATLTLTWEA